MRTELQLRSQFWLYVAYAEDRLGIPDHLSHPLAMRERVRERVRAARRGGIPYLGMLMDSGLLPKTERLLARVAIGIAAVEEYRRERKERAKRVYH